MITGGRALPPHPPHQPRNRENDVAVTAEQSSVSELARLPTSRKAQSRLARRAPRNSWLQAWTQDLRWALCGAGGSARNLGWWSGMTDAAEESAGTAEADGVSDGVFRSVEYRSWRVRTTAGRVGLPAGNSAGLRKRLQPAACQVSRRLAARFRRVLVRAGSPRLKCGRWVGLDARSRHPGRGDGPGTAAANHGRGRPGTRTDLTRTRSRAEPSASPGRTAAPQLRSPMPGSRGYGRAAGGRRPPVPASPSRLAPASAAPHPSAPPTIPACDG